MISEHDELFTPTERRALRLWRVPEPPVDFAARVLAQMQQEIQQEASESTRAGGGSMRGIAAAAAALVLVGSLFTARLLSSAPHRASVGIPAAPNDGGRASEVSPLVDGVRS